MWIYIKTGLWECTQQKIAVGARRTGIPTLSLDHDELLPQGVDNETHCQDRSCFASQRRFLEHAVLPTTVPFAERLEGLVHSLVQPRNQTSLNNSAILTRNGKSLRDRIRCEEARLTPGLKTQEGVEVDIACIN